MKAIAKHMLYYVLLAAVGLVVYLALSGHAQAAETAVTASQGLEGALVDIIQQVSGGVKQGVDFLQAEIPDVVRQLLLWQLAKSLIIATVALIALCTVVYGAALTFIWSRDVDKDMFGFALYCIFIVGFVGGGSVVALVIYGFNALKIYIAPKVWLIEYAASLVK